MKKILPLLLVLFLLTGCFGDGGSVTSKPTISNTSSTELNLMDENIYYSHYYSRSHYVVLRIGKTKINEFNKKNKDEESQKNDPVLKYLYWLEEGVCYNASNLYKCGSLDFNNRLNLFYGDIAVVKIEDNKGVYNTPSLAFYNGRTFYKNITLESLDGKAAGRFEQEKQFRSTIIENIHFDQINLASYEFLQSAAVKQVKLNASDIEEKTINKNTYRYYQTLKEAEDNKETFLLLTTSKRSNSYCIFTGSHGEDGKYDCGESEDNINKFLEENYGENICEQHISKYYGSLFTSVCSQYESHLTDLAKKYGFKYYHIEITSLEIEEAVMEHTILAGSPQISFFAGGALQDVIVGFVSKEYIENKLRTWGVYSKDLTFHVDSYEASSKEDDKLFFGLESPTKKFDLYLYFSTLFNSKYFISENELFIGSGGSLLNVNNYDSYYNLEDNIYKGEFEINDDDEGNNINVRNLRIGFDTYGTRYIYLYSEDSSGNKGVAKFAIITHARN